MNASNLRQREEHWKLKYRDGGGGLQRLGEKCEGVLVSHRGERGYDRQTPLL